MKTAIKKSFFFKLNKIANKKVYSYFHTLSTDSIGLEYQSFGIRYFGILPASVHHCSVV